MPDSRTYDSSRPDARTTGVSLCFRNTPQTNKVICRQRNVRVFLILTFAFIRIFIGLSYEEFDGYEYLMVKALAIVHFKRKRQERKRKVRREKRMGEKGKEVKGEGSVRKRRVEKRRKNRKYKR